MTTTLGRLRATLIALPALFALLLALAPAADAVRFGERALRQGDRGRDVRVLQSWLTHLGYRTSVDGHFGRRTKLNVKRWEIKDGRPANGVVSRADAARLRELVEGDNRGGGPGGPDEPESGQGDETPGQSPEEGQEPPAADQPQNDPAGSQPGETTGPKLIFPVRGPHDYGGAAARYGAPRGGRSHKGHDVFAACGTRVKAVEGGKVVYAGYQSAAGNYIVIKGATTKRDYVYMHLQRPALFKTGASVPDAALIGNVGETGNAQGCHVHFELWTAPGWYDGGRAVDPLPHLKEWDSYS